MKIIGAPLAPYAACRRQDSTTCTSASLPHLSLYSFRYLFASEFYLLHRQLKSLPSDTWQYCMDKAGRAEISGRRCKQRLAGSSSSGRRNG